MSLSIWIIQDLHTVVDINSTLKCILLSIVNINWIESRHYYSCLKFNFQERQHCVYWCTLVTLLTPFVTRVILSFTLCVLVGVQWKVLSCGLEAATLGERFRDCWANMANLFRWQFTDHLKYSQYLYLLRTLGKILWCTVKEFRHEIACCLLFHVFLMGKYHY